MPFSITREGIRFLVLLGIVSFAAYNTRNSLLYLMLSIGIASAIAGLGSGWLSLRGLRFAGSEVPDAFAGEPFEESVSLSNSDGGLDAFGVSVEGDGAELPLLARGTVGRCRVERLYRRRGVYEGEPLSVASRFPFGFFRFSRSLEAPRKLIVFPRLRPVAAEVLPMATPGAWTEARRPGRGEEFFLLREYVPGDHVHHIHWKTSARLGQLMVRELGDDARERLAVAFRPALEDAQEPSDLEILVSAVASLVAHLARRGMRFHFVADGLEIQPDDTRDPLRRVLVHLAGVGRSDGESTAWVDAVGRALGDGETVLFVGYPGTLPQRLSSEPNLHALEPARLFSS